jgi:hypothetical protein
VRDQVSHPYKTRGKIIFLYILIFTLLYSELEDKRFCAEWQQAFPDFNLLFISLWMQFWCVSVVPKYLDCSQFQTIYRLFHVVILSSIVYTRHDRVLPDQSSH